LQQGIQPKDLDVKQLNPLQTRAVSSYPDRFGDRIGVLEDEVLEQVVLALALVTGLS
jgi:hypothetical protein